MWVFKTQAIALIIFAQIILISCVNFDPQQNALANALQSILSPANTERAMQIIQLAANQQIGNAPCREEKVVPISSPQANRRLLPIGTLQRLATPNAEQFFIKQTPQYSQFNVPQSQNIAEVVPSNALPMQNLVQSTSKFTMPNIPLSIARDIPQELSAKQFSCPCASQTLVNPFLPAASPISALSPPTSSLLPSAFPMQSRGHFLRKIPIPPPTL